MSALLLFRSGSESALQFYRRSENRSAAPFSGRSAEREPAPKSKERLMLCCLVCQEAKCKPSGREPIREMKIGKGIPGEAMAMDIGTLPWADSSEGGYRYFLLMVDLFTRYIEIQPYTIKKQARSSRRFNRDGFIMDMVCHR